MPHIHFQYQHRQLIEDPMLRCPFIMGHSILHKCFIPRSFSSSNHQTTHSKANRFIRTLAFPVVPRHPISICRISSRGHMPVALMVAVEACKAFQPQKASLHSHYQCSNDSNSSNRTSMSLINVANLSPRWVVKIAHQLLIVEFHVRA